MSCLSGQDPSQKIAVASRLSYRDRKLGQNLSDHIVVGQYLLQIKRVSSNKRCIASLRVIRRSNDCPLIGYRSRSINDNPVGITRTPV